MKFCRHCRRPHDDDAVCDCSGAETADMLWSLAGLTVGMVCLYLLAITLGGVQ